MPGNVWCWGQNNNGQLGDGTYNNSAIPVQVKDGHIFTSITRGQSHTCALESSGKAWCWGDGSQGQLGNGNTSSKNYPVPVSNPPAAFSSIVGGYYHTCGLDASGNAYCWGYNNAGQLGDGTTTKRTTPVIVVSGPTFTSLAGGYYHTCGIDKSGNAWCWGRNDYGQLGDGTTTQRTTPVIVSGHTFTSIAAGDYHTCGIDSSGYAWCWGKNTLGQLGIGVEDANNHVVPEQVLGGNIFTSIGAGNQFSCARDLSGNAWCWDNGFGASSIPIKITGGYTFASVYAGTSHVIGIISLAGAFVQSYVTTTWQNSLQNIGLIDSVDIDETVSDSTTPYQSTTRWLVSFDGTNWGKLSPPQSYICQWTSKTSDLSSFDFLNNGNTSTEIENDLNTCSLPNNARTLYFAIDLLSADGHVLPQVNNIQVKYYK